MKRYIHLILFSACFIFVMTWHTPVLALDLSWNMIMTTGSLPQERTGAGGIYDPVRDKFIIFGGWELDLDFYVNEVWELDCVTYAWKNISPIIGDTPAGRSRAVVVYDSNTDRMIVFGGTSFLIRYNDLWVYDFNTNTWNQISPLNTPPAPRTGSCGIFDDDNNRLIIHGGYKDSFILPEPTEEIWEFSFNTYLWTEITPIGNKPSARDSSTAILDPRTDSMVIFGGYSGNIFGWTEYHDTWTFDLATHAFTERTHPTFNPPDRSDHAAVYDKTHHKMIVFGGGTLLSLDFKSDVWSMDLDSFNWTNEPVSGTPPSGRGGIAYALDSKRRRMLIFGGHYLNVSSAGVLNETWELTGFFPVIPGLSLVGLILLMIGIPVSICVYPGIGFLKH